jgi:tellurite resistance protein TerC
MSEFESDNLPTEGPMDAFVQFPSADFLGKPAWLWRAFLAVVAVLLLLELGLLHREDREIGVQESLVLSGGYVGLGLAFGAWVWWYLGSQSGMEYLTGFMVEKTLAMDNVFVIAMIFTFFAVPRPYQHRVPFWGILGVSVLRAIMIGLGAALVTQFGWVLYLFGAFLVLTGIKMLVMIDHTFDVAGNPVLRFLRSRLRVTAEPHGHRFFVKLPAPEVQGGPPSTRAHRIRSHTTDRQIVPRRNPWKSTSRPATFV